MGSTSWRRSEVLEWKGLAYCMATGWRVLRAELMAMRTCGMSLTKTYTPTTRTKHIYDTHTLLARCHMGFMAPNMHAVKKHAGAVFSVPSLGFVGCSTPLSVTKLPHEARWCHGLQCNRNTTRYSRLYISKPKEGTRGKTVDTSTLVHT